MLGGWLVRLLIIVLVIRALWSLIAGIVGGASKPPRKSPRAGGERSLPLARCPVCGTFVQQSRALTLRAGGRTHYFCSEKCRQAFGQQARPA